MLQWPVVSWLACTISMLSRMLFGAWLVASNLTYNVTLAARVEVCDRKRTKVWVSDFGKLIDQTSTFGNYAFSCIPVANASCALYGQCICPWVFAYSAIVKRTSRDGCRHYNDGSLNDVTSTWCSEDGNGKRDATSRWEPRQERRSGHQSGRAYAFGTWGGRSGAQIRGRTTSCWRDSTPWIRRTAVRSPLKTHAPMVDRLNFRVEMADRFGTRVSEVTLNIRKCQIHHEVGQIAKFWPSKRQGSITNIIDTWNLPLACHPLGSPWEAPSPTRFCHVDGVTCSLRYNGEFSTWEGYDFKANGNCHHFVNLANSSP